MSLSSQDMWDLDEWNWRLQGLVMYYFFQLVMAFREGGMGVH